MIESISGSGSDRRARRVGRPAPPDPVDAEAERRNVAAELHDCALQLVLAARQDVHDAPDDPAALARTRATLDAAIAELRRIITGEPPPSVSSRGGLAADLEALCDRAAHRAGIVATSRVDPEAAGGPHDDLLFMLAREFVENTIKHAHAGNLVLTVQVRSPHVELTVADDGRGFPQDHGPHHTRRGHLGLPLAAQRIGDAGGNLTFDARPGGGTVVTVLLPRASDVPSLVLNGSTDGRNGRPSAPLDRAEQRDRAADARDLAALARDAHADARERTMDRTHVAEILGLTAADRKDAAADRKAAVADRAAAAADREHAAADRFLALAEYAALARRLEVAETDGLTGARTRAAGLLDLDHEIERSRRTDVALVVTYVDVVGLKRVNDSEGHLAGDRLLQRVVTQIRTRLRPYDLIIRLGGDEFLCVTSNTTVVEARQRFDEITAALACAPDAARIRAGFAQLTRHDSNSDLIARADSDLLDNHGTDAHAAVARRNGHR